MTDQFKIVEFLAVEKVLVVVAVVAVV